MKSETTIKVDLAHPSIGTRVEAMQGDGNTRRITVQLLDDGKPWHPPADAEIAVAYTQPGGTRGFYNQLPDGSPAVRVNGSRVTVLLASAMLRVPGRVSAAVVFNNPQLDQLTSFPFTVTVTESPYVGAQQAEDYIRLQWLENKLDEWVQRMMSTEKAVAAAAAAERADTAADNAQSQAAAAGAAATAANTAAARATLAKATAETAAVAASDAAAAANTASGAAQEQAAAAEEAASNANAAAQGADTARDAANTAADAANQAAAAAQGVVDTVVPDVQQLKQSVAAETKRAQEAEDNRIKKFYTSNNGALSIADSDDGAVRNLVIYGKSEQGANPSPENPQKIRSVESCSVTVSNVDCMKTQDSPIPFTLRGIGKVWDELHIYEDGTGRLVRRVDVVSISELSINDWGYSNGGTIKDYYVEVERYDESPNYTKRFMSVLCNKLVNTDNSKTNIITYKTISDGGWNGQSRIIFNVPADIDTVDKLREYLGTDCIILYPLKTPIETTLTAQQVEALFDLRTYYGGTNITFTTENGVEPAVHFDYACSLENFVEYIKAAQGDDRKFIYDMDERMTDAEYMAAVAYVNSEYAAALTELEG